MIVPLALSQTAINVTYLVAGVCLIVGIRRLSAPRTARSGNVVAAVGMAIALVFTLVDSDIDSYWLIAAGVAVGTAIGAVSARKVKMTAMPQMVALFNGVGGGAAALIAASEFHRLAPAGKPLSAPFPSQQCPIPKSPPSTGLRKRSSSSDSIHSISLTCPPER